MKLFRLIILLIALSGFTAVTDAAPKASHTFTLGKNDFLLDGKPFQIISGEMHYGRIPAEYWRQRIQMAKAMGCNSIATYVFWNYHQKADGSFDFKTWNRNLAAFAKIVQEEGMWLILRPGPYACAEWDFGGLPVNLLKIPDIKIRCSDPRYMQAVAKYIDAMAAVVKPLQINKGGNMIMLQIENEYGSYGNDRDYLLALKQMWEAHGINIPFYTSDGPTPFMLEAGSLPGCAIGLDSGSSLHDFELANKMQPGVPVMSGETYPGWLTHWGERMAHRSTEGVVKSVKFLMDNKKSFNLYMIHGGTNFGFTAGANSGGKGYQPDITSYDYDAPVNEHGSATPKYMALRELIQSYRSDKLPDIPAPIDTIALPAIKMNYYTSIWDNLKNPVHTAQPLTFEAVDQDQGFIVYRTRLIGHKNGNLRLTQLHDYATVFLNGQYIGKIDRREGQSSIELPKTDAKTPLLDIVVEGMGHINFAQEMIDRKGITERATLNGMTLMKWEMYKFPMDDAFIKNLKPGKMHSDKPGIFFKGTFTLSKTGDAWFNMKNYEKGTVWINGHNLGRYWNIGPQFRLYCPASWLKKGTNELIVFDQHQTEAQTID